jgi:type VI secretion system protein ImpK
MSDTRVASLASTFQEVLTAIVRVRFRLHRVEEAQHFRTQIRQSLQRTMHQARALGYSGEIVQTAVFAAVALLDESVLNLQDPVFADWSRRPLQEELFGGHLAGETFFHNLRACLAQQDSAELADVLELHCICLLLGYRGRYALGDSGELYSMLRRARERINRIRGEANLTPRPDPASAKIGPAGQDGWSRHLMWAACILVAIAAIAFGGYSVELASGVSFLHNSSLNLR